MRAPDPTIIEAERQSLAAIMRRGPAFDRVADVLTVDDFGHPEHRAIFAAMCQIASSAAEPSFDPWTVASAMGASPSDTEAAARLDAIVASASPAGLDGAVTAIRAASVLRQLDAAATEIRQLADAATYAAAVESVSRAEALLSNISTGARTAADMTLRTALRLLVADVRGAVEGRRKSVLISSGLEDLDRAMGGGFRPGYEHLLGARPKMGKTALAVQIAANVALQGRGVVYQTTEVPREHITQRVLTTVARVRAAVLDTEVPTADDFSAMLNAVERLASPAQWVLIADEPAATPQDVARNVRRYSRLKGAPPLGLVVVDQINDLYHPSPRNGMSRERELAEINNTLKDLFRSANVPGLVLSQLSRKCEDRPNKRPTPADLRDSGSLEQQAGLVMFLYRDEVYAQTPDNKGKAEVIVSLNRKGPTGLAQLHWSGDVQRFDDPAPGWMARRE